MSTLAALWERVKSSPAVLPSNVVIPSASVDGGTEPKPFSADSHYFEVVLNEMYLKDGREWLSRYDPLVFVATDFSYDTEMETVPFIVGPGLIQERYGQKPPERMLFTNTRVAGIHPYRGGRFGLTLVLSRVERRNYADELLGVLERTASALDFSGSLGAYLKVAGALLDGVQTLLGRDETQPLVGVRTEFGRAQSRTPLVAAHVALIAEENVQADSLRVEGGQLLTAEGEPFRRADYALLSIEPHDTRDDVETLPFFKPLWERIVHEAMNPTDDAWESAKANLTSLAQTFHLSPDITRREAFDLVRTYTDAAKAYRDEAQEIAKMAPREGEPDDIAAARQATLDILTL